MARIPPTATDLASAQRPVRRSATYRLAVSSYDRTSSLLIALLVMVSLLVAGLIIVYVTRQLIQLSVTKTVTLTDVASRPADAAMGLKRDIEPPGREDAPELTEPELPETLLALTSATTARQAILDDVSIESDVEAGRGKGLGDSRRAGTGGEGADERVAREDRWHIRYENVPSQATYVRQLDYFQIELGTLGPDNQIHYVYNLTQSPPDTRTGSSLDETRIHLAWIDGALKQADLKIIQSAGVPNPRGFVLKFIPPELEALLLKLELEHAQGRSVNDINRTVFVVREVNNDEYRFEVVEQQYRYLR